MLKRILLVVIAMIILAIAFGGYLWFMPKRNFANATPDITISADSLFNSFSKNEKHSDSIYLKKVILVRGAVSQITENQNKEKVVVLQTSDPIFGVSCTMYKNDSVEVNKLKSGNQVSIKGFCTGFGTDVVITNSSVVK